MAIFARWTFGNQINKSRKKDPIFGFTLRLEGYPNPVKGPFFPENRPFPCGTGPAGPIPPFGINGVKPGQSVSDVKVSDAGVR